MDTTTRRIALRFLPLFILHLVAVVGFASSSSSTTSSSNSNNGVGRGLISAVGDPEMKSPNIRVALEAWNFCNEVGAVQSPPNLPSPRFADCADLYCPVISFSSDSTTTDQNYTSHQQPSSSSSRCKVHQRVTESDNSLKAGDEFPSHQHFTSYTDPDLYAKEKELYLGSLCESSSASTSSSSSSGQQPWQFWMIMLKNGNFDKNTTLCPENGKKVDKIVTKRTFPCFGQGCMNQPFVYHNYSTVKYGKTPSLTGGFYGTYDLDAARDLSNVGGAVNGEKWSPLSKSSFFSVSWEKNTTTQSWVFKHKLVTSPKYPWLMLYLRADANRGFNGGYHYEGRGVITKPLVSPNFKVKLTLNIKRGGGPNSQFYLSDIGSCWKNTGSPCDGDTTTDVTRYSEMILNPDTTNWCKPDNLVSCPPHHVTATGDVVYRNDTARFPYAAYHLYCGPGNAEYAKKPVDVCDPYSNPQAQELVQILPHREWSVHGYPERKGDGWIGDPRTWELDVGALSARLYFYQDPGTKPAKRVWTSINVGTEIYISSGSQTAEWTVSDFNVLTKDDDDHHHHISSSLSYGTKSL